MSEQQFYIEGLDELIEVLSKKMPKEFDRAAKVGMTKSVFDVVRWAKYNAPWDTGRMRSSIAGRVETPFGNVRGVIGTNVKYAPFVEQPGNVIRGGRRPWLRPAVEEHVREIQRNFEDAFKRVIKRLGF